MSNSGNRGVRACCVGAAMLVLVVLAPADGLLSRTAGAQDAPVTFYQWTADAAPDLDPQSGAGQDATDIVANLFLALTDYDPVGGEVLPALAAAWEASDDGREFTFTLRDDVYWVRYDPNTHITARVRVVTAPDFAAGLQRLCTPGGGQLGALLRDIVVGCDAAAPDVDAPDARTLVVALKQAAGWFLSLTPAIRPAPADVIDRYGAGWTLPGNLVTTGPFVLTQYTPGQRVALARANTYFPQDLQGAGNVQRVIYDIVRDTNAGFSLYLEHKADTSMLPALEVAGFVGQRPDEAALLPAQRVAYLGFINDRAPFNDVRVRLAFAAALDRAAFAADVLGGAGRPMTHLAPPGVVGAPAIDQIGVRYDPELARAALAEAGYPACAGFPYVTLLAHQSTSAWVDFMVGSWRDVLGCSKAVFKVELADFATLLTRTGPDTSYADLPHLFTLAWHGEYPDEHAWVGELLDCKAAPRTRRPCSETDDLIVQAAGAGDLARRRALYAQIEAQFFDPEGTIPLVPLYQQAYWLAVKPWVSLPPQLAGGLATVGRVRWDDVVIDGELQQRCRRKADDTSACGGPSVPLPLPATPTETPSPTSTPRATAQPNADLGDISIPVTATPTPTLSARPPGPP
ncbi:MAG: hypothetical protein JXB47_21110 [Anaerolineae bacterium]|nr:hypothetical protein [Anaerolineae bacterium]